MNNGAHNLDTFKLQHNTEATLAGLEKVLGEQVENTAADAIGTAGSIMGPVAKVAGAATGLIAHKILSQSPVQRGTTSTNASILNIKLQPFIKINRNVSYNKNMTEGSIGSTCGMPQNEYVGRLGELSGFTRVQDVHVEINGAMQEELNMIEQQLKKGVILQW